MTRKTCTKCNKRKELDQFVAARIAKDGKRSNCKQCDSKYRCEKLACPDCGKMVSRSCMRTHQKTTCGKPKPKYKHDGDDVIECPGCKRSMKEKTVYRHVKYPQLCWVYPERKSDWTLNIPFECAPHSWWLIISPKYILIQSTYLVTQLDVDSIVNHYDSEKKTSRGSGFESADPQKTLSPIITFFFSFCLCFLTFFAVMAHVCSQGNHRRWAQ